mmetsp:Transcript_99533/g.319434  ORF Transcript_99533/g.319434 Transcript_99533/m.319434 type:complete len:235 (+) Transcript_99533:2075-2779(+)
MRIKDRPHGDRPIVIGGELHQGEPRSQDAAPPLPVRLAVRRHTDHREGEHDGRREGCGGSQGSQGSHQCLHHRPQCRIADHEAHTPGQAEDAENPQRRHRRNQTIQSDNAVAAPAGRRKQDHEGHEADGHKHRVEHAPGGACIATAMVADHIGCEFHHVGSSEQQLREEERPIQGLAAGHKVHGAKARTQLGLAVRVEHQEGGIAQAEHGHHEVEDWMSDHAPHRPADQAPVSE